MKTIVLLCFLIVTAASNLGMAQEWRDTLNRARELYKKGNYKEALKYYKSADRLAPNDVDLSEEKGQSAYRAGKYKEAEEAFRTAASKQTDTKRKASAYHNVGNARMKLKDYAGAEESYKEALRLDPKNEKARQQLAEAKRLKKEQEEQEKKKQQEKKPSDPKDPGDDKPNEGEGDPKQGEGQGQNNNKPKQPQDGEGKPNNNDAKPQPGSASKKQKLTDQQTERKLNELMRQEMDAKKRLDGSKGKTNGSKAKKDW
ncbi:MAG: tetratricopeptide repeat protein [Fluviicola sp.]|nr:tetratricopeptide repeat protein [Fluviicola sp.]